MDPLIGAAAISGVSSLLGGALSSITGNSAQRREYERQKEFAQNGISWRVADAESAGLHPLAAIGANVTSYTPQAVTGNDFGLESFGQGLESFVRNYKSPRERAHQRWLEKTGAILGIRQQELQNQKTESEIRVNDSIIGMNNAEASALALRYQPGNPKPLANPVQTEDRIKPLPGSVRVGEGLFEWNQTEDPGVWRLLPTSEAASKFEDKALLEYTPFADSFRAGGFHGKTLQGMIYSPLHHGWIRLDGQHAQELKDYLEQKERERIDRNNRILYEHH